MSGRTVNSFMDIRNFFEIVSYVQELRIAAKRMSNAVQSSFEYLFQRDKSNFQSFERILSRRCRSVAATVYLDK